MTRPKPWTSRTLASTAKSARGWCGSAPLPPAPDSTVKQLAGGPFSDVGVAADKHTDSSIGQHFK
eukprot:2566071-Pyramimonas_sp.AAC.1